VRCRIQKLRWWPAAIIAGRARRTLNRRTLAFSVQTERSGNVTSQTSQKINKRFLAPDFGDQTAEKIDRLSDDIEQP